MTDKFPALLIDKKAQPHAQVTDLTLDDLPAGKVLVKVAYAAINYVDAAMVCGASNIGHESERYVPGADLAGTVASSSDPAFKEGDQVMACGIDLGSTTHGGFAGYCRLDPGHLFQLPDGLDMRSAMIFGSAGITAILAIEAITASDLPKQAAILQTSIAGGVCSVIAALMTKQPHDLHLVIQPQQKEYAGNFNPASIIERADFLKDEKAMGEPRWDGAIDTAGGKILSTLLSQLKPHALAACCGVSAGGEFTTTSMPFILRNITVKGVGSYGIKKARKAELIGQMAQYTDVLDKVNTHEMGLSSVIEASHEIISGKSLGRKIVKFGSNT